MGHPPVFSVGYLLFLFRQFSHIFLNPAEQQTNFNPIEHQYHTQQKAQHKSKEGRHHTTPSLLLELLEPLWGLFWPSVAPSTSTAL